MVNPSTLQHPMLTTMPVKIQQIADRLGVDPTVVLKAANSCGIKAAVSATSELDRVTGQYLEEQLIKSCIAKRLPRTAMLAEPAFKAPEARLSDFVIARARIEGWDKKLPRPEKITAAAHHAQKQAEKQVHAIESRANQVEQTNMTAQREAVALRLSREVAGLLRYLDANAADLWQLAESQAQRPGPLAERIRQARQRLGETLSWTEQTRWEFEQSLKRLTPDDKQVRLSSTSLDAGFADCRWRCA